MVLPQQQSACGLKALSSLRGLRGAPEVPPLCRETQSLGQQMLERWEGAPSTQRPILCYTSVYVVTGPAHGN